MFEIVASWLEPVISHPVVQSIITHYFICGIICGIVLVYLLRWLLWVFFRKKYLRNVSVAGDSGEITISAAAISHVIVHASKSLKCLDTRKVCIFNVKGGYTVDVRAVMNAASGTAPQLMDKISGIVRSQMSTVFGIGNIQKVTLNIINCSSSAPEKAPEEVKDPADDKEPEKNPEFFHSAGHGDRTISLKFHDNKPAAEEKTAEPAAGKKSDGE